MHINSYTLQNSVLQCSIQRSKSSNNLSGIKFEYIFNECSIILEQRIFSLLIKSNKSSY